MDGIGAKKEEHVFHDVREIHKTIVADLKKDQDPETKMMLEAALVESVRQLSVLEQRNKVPLKFPEVEAYLIDPQKYKKEVVRNTSSLKGDAQMACVFNEMDRINSFVGIVDQNHSYFIKKNYDMQRALETYKKIDQHLRSLIDYSLQKNEEPHDLDHIQDEKKTLTKELTEIILNEDGSTESLSKVKKIRARLIEIDKSVTDLTVALN